MSDQVDIRKGKRYTPRGETGFVRLSTLISGELKDAIRAKAGEKKMTISQYIESVLWKAVK